MTTHYETLAVSPTATDADIKSAYRRMSRLYHPDLAGPSGEVQMGRINEAFDAVKSSELRAAYDRSLVSAPAPLAEPVPNFVPEEWGSEETEWAAEPQPGARHRADDVPEPAGDAPSMRAPIVSAVALVLLMGAFAISSWQWQAHQVSMSSWSLTMSVTTVSAIIQLFKREFGLVLNGLLALSTLAAPLGYLGVWGFSSWLGALGPIAAISISALGPLVWAVRWGIWRPRAE